MSAATSKPMRSMAPAITATTCTIFRRPMPSTASTTRPKHAARSLLGFKENPREASASRQRVFRASPGMVRDDARDGAVARTGMRFWTGIRCPYTIVRASRPGGIGRWASAQACAKAMPRRPRRKLGRWTRCLKQLRSAGEAQSAGRAAGRRGRSSKVTCSRRKEKPKQAIKAFRIGVDGAAQASL